MQPNSSAKRAGAAGRSRVSRILRIGAAVTVGLAGVGFGAAGCLTRPLCEPDCHPHTTNLYVNVVEQKSIDKIDLLFMIDDSSSMGDKQATLQAAVPDLVNGLVNPVCVTGDPPVPVTTGQPTDPSQPCPPGSEREFKPIKNIHIGIVTSSLGGHGVACKVAAGGFPDDKGELLGSLPRYTSAYPGAPNVDPLGFLDWNPDTHAGQTGVSFGTDFTNMVKAATQNGCGYEAQLESWYHFLADPNPYDSVTLGPCPGASGAQCAFPTGVDQTILNQRKAFLRADSLLAVIMLTDENDCSVQDDGQGWYVAGNPKTQMFIGSAQCDSNPNDPCCYPCTASGGVPAGAVPATCQNTCAGRAQTTTKDPLNLRCFEMKRRFGVDYLYPTNRYSHALTLQQLCTSRHDLDPAGAGGCPDLNGDGKPDVYPNPIYTDLSGQGIAARDPDLVFFAGIVGVPWQDIMDQANSNSTTLTYLKATSTDPNVPTIPWDKILGNPNTGTTNAPVAPGDPHMIESRSPRSGIPPQTGTLMQDPINGHEFSNTGGAGVAVGDGSDLQHACIFKLATPTTCAPDGADCDCAPPPSTATGGVGIAYDTNNPYDLNPLCQQPDGTYSSLQGYAKAYPGLRELDALKNFGGNSIVASICARNLDPAAIGNPDYGYRPAVTAIIDRLKDKLGPQCLPRQLEPDNTGAVPCNIIEANPNPETCDAAKGRSNVTNDQVIVTAKARLRAEGVCDAAGKPACDSFSFCQIDQAVSGTNATVCHKDTVVPAGTTPGWCYVSNPPDPVDVVGKGCTRSIRFIDPNLATPVSGARALIACFGAPISSVSGDGG